MSSESQADKTEFNLMITGQPYLASDPYISVVRDAQALKLRGINREDDDKKRNRLFSEFIHCKDPCFVLPFFCEYGFNITIGKGCFLGTGTTILDVSPVTIGDRTMFGPNCQLYTPTHPISPEERNGLKGREASRAIKIGSDCWLGGAVIVLAGVTIGNGVTVGAGSVVTKDVKDRCVVVGNPARWVKDIP